MLFLASSRLSFYHQNHAGSYGFVSARIHPRYLSVKFLKKIRRNVNQDSPDAFLCQFASPFTLFHEANRLLHEVHEVSFFQGERVPTCIELLLNDAKLHHFLEIFDAAAIVTSSFSRY